MKKIYSLLFVILSLMGLAQSPPPAINYQGVARSLSGIPITGAIGVKIDIHKSSANGPVVFSEPHTPTTNSFGIFNLQIGSINASQFISIDWSQGPYFVEVSIDPTGGASYVSTGAQQLVSVPYALYAEKAKNIPTYAAGSNVTITPGSSNNYTIDVASSAGGGPWTSNGNNVYLITGANSVGIGNATPTAKLEVNTGTASAMDAIYATTGTGNAIIGSASTTSTLNAGVKGINSASGSGVYGINSSGGTGVFGENTGNNASTNAHGVNGKTNSQAPLSAGVLGENYGSGPGLYGYQGNASAGSNGVGVMGISNTPNAPGVQGTNNNGNIGVAGIITSGGNSPTSHGVYGKTNSTNPNAAAVKGDNTGNAGSGVFGVANSTVGAGVYGDNTLGNGVFGRANSSNTLITTAGVQGNHYGSGHGVYGITLSSNVNNSGVYGQNNGAGSGVVGVTASNDVTAVGVYGTNNGTGIAVKATIPSGFTAGATNLSVLMENGHIRSTQPNPPTTNVSLLALGGFTANPVMIANSTDVKGGVQVNTNITGGVSSGNYVDINVSFVKPFTVAPTIVITPFETHGLTYMIVSMSNINFTVRIKNTTAASISIGATLPANAFRFSYMVIE